MEIEKEERLITRRRYPSQVRKYIEVTKETKEEIEEITLEADEEEMLKKFHTDKVLSTIKIFTKTRRTIKKRTANNEIEETITILKTTFLGQNQSEDLEEIVLEEQHKKQEDSLSTKNDKKRINASCLKKISSSNESESCLTEQTNLQVVDKQQNQSCLKKISSSNESESCLTEQTNLQVVEKQQNQNYIEKKETMSQLTRPKQGEKDYLSWLSLSHLESKKSTSTRRGGFKERSCGCNGVFTKDHITIGFHNCDHDGPFQIGCLPIFIYASS
eukprot:Awhi_evm1s3207